ncbi:hypothetical protein [Lysinibacillus fusiformis]|nr:hypothetical protein [Lysinibacillus fusiformis]
MVHFLKIILKEGNNRKIMVNEKWEQHKEYVRAKLAFKTVWMGY